MSRTHKHEGRFAVTAALLICLLGSVVALAGKSIRVDRNGTNYCIGLVNTCD